MDELRLTIDRLVITGAPPVTPDELAARLVAEIRRAVEERAARLDSMMLRPGLTVPSGAALSEGELREIVAEAASRVLLLLGPAQQERRA